MNNTLRTHQFKAVSISSFISTQSGLLQRKCACGQHTVAGGECAKCRKKRGNLQRKVAGHTEPETVPSIVHEVLRSPGQPLDAGTRAFMEPRFGHDFSRVRLHTDARAAKSARAVNALAFTVGSDVVFGAGRYTSGRAAGQRLLAHELAHVVQQKSISSGAYDFDTLQVGPPDDAFEREAEAIAQTFAGAFGPRPTPELPQNRAVIQRQFDTGRKRFPLSEPFKRQPGVPLPYREATELAECIRIMGEENRAYCRQEVLGETPSPLPRLEIRRDGGVGDTFVSTDRLSFTAHVVNAPSGARPNLFNWTVHGISANAGNGNPHSAANQARFTFRPNPTNRPTAGSRLPNDPIEYRVEAQTGTHRASFSLIQDETDIIRQEYIDYGSANPPPRGDIVRPTNATYNTGNYTLIVDRGMDNALNNTQAEFQTLTPAAELPPPAITVTSGYRNPQRNVAVGSNFPVGSRHVWGRALDLSVAGANATLWARLRQAGSNAGNVSICEDGPTQKPCNDPTVDHVHIQW